METKYFIKSGSVAGELLAIDNDTYIIKDSDNIYNVKKALAEFIDSYEYDKFKSGEPDGFFIKNGEAKGYLIAKENDTWIVISDGKVENWKISESEFINFKEYTK